MVEARCSDFYGKVLIERIKTNMKKKIEKGKKGKSGILITPQTEIYTFTWQMEDNYSNTQIR